MAAEIKVLSRHRGLQWSIALDLAVTKKDEADASVIQPFAIDSDLCLYFKEPIYLREETPDLIEEVCAACEIYAARNDSPVIDLFNEKGVIHNAIAPQLEIRVIDLGLAVNIIPVSIPGDKAAKARVLQSRMQLGQVYFEDCEFFRTIWLPEFLGFGAGSAHDDLVDAGALAAYVVQQGVVAVPPEKRVIVHEESEHDLTWEDLKRRAKHTNPDAAKHIPKYMNGKERRTRDPLEDRYKRADPLKGIRR